MKKITFEFLKDMVLKEVDKSPTSVTGGKTPVAGAHLRLFSDGSIYPSRELVELHTLEYQPKNVDQPENGYDVFLSSEWDQYLNLNANAVPFICIAPTSKHNLKVDLFAQTKYDKEGNPKSSVLNQKTTSGLHLIKLLEQVYLNDPETESIFEGSVYVDLRIVLDKPLTPSKTGIYNIPKILVKGKKAGKKSYCRREHLTIYPLEIVEKGAPEKVKETPAQVPSKNEAALPTDDVAAALFQGN